jgi:hypothetical protein
MLGIQPPGTYCEAVGFQLYNIPNLEQVRGIEWELVEGQSYWDGPSRSGLRIPEVVFYPECNETVTFRARYSNECGFSEWTQYTVDLNVCADRCSPPSTNTGITGPNFNISPNPADDYMFIGKVNNPIWNFPNCDDGDTTIDPGNGSNNHCTYFVAVTMYDWNGTQVLQTIMQLGTQLDVSGLQPGTHIMHISMGSQMEQHQIIIE